MTDKSTTLPENFIQIFVKGVNGKTVTIDISKDASIQELFTLASKRTLGEETENIRLLFQGKDLRTHENKKVMYLKDYEMENHCTVHMVLRLLGGSQEERRFAAGARLTDLPDALQMDYDLPKRALMPCGHAIGPNSLFNLCNAQLEAGKFDFCCPIPECRKRWDYSDIRNTVLLSSNENISFQTNLTENYILKSMQFQECPQCKSLCEKKFKQDICVTCPVCTKIKGKRYEFCWYCLQKWSSPNYRSCTNPDCDGCDTRAKFLREVECKEIGGVTNCPTVRACPKCGLLIEHKEKCKHMECRCGHNFCFICLKEQVGRKWQCGTFNSMCKVAPVQEIIPGN